MHEEVVNAVDLSVWPSGSEPGRDAVAEAADGTVRFAAAGQCAVFHISLNLAIGIHDLSHSQLPVLFLLTI